MKNAVGVVMLSTLAACTHTPIAVRSAPAPTPEQLVQVRALQTRLIPTPFDSVFPKVLDVLMDNDYVIRSADAKLGFVSFYQQWTDSTQGAATITQEGSLVFRSAGPTSTQVRAILTGGWQQVVSTGGGAHSFSVSSQVGAAQTAGADQYQKLLDALQAGLTSSR